MKLKACNLMCFLMLSGFVFSQNSIKGVVVDQETGLPVPFVEVYDEAIGKLVETNDDGSYELADVDEGIHKITFFSYQYTTLKKDVEVNGDKITKLDVELYPLAVELSEVVISQKRKELFALKRLKDVDETAIYAGKKSEVVLVGEQMGNMAINNARQVFSQVVGLNIYESNDGGLQLNIGGRGLDPNRSANFNIRQNGYDISADVLGYPESYYTPPTEALQEIQIVRGAASLQYGTQFGGLVNFKIKEPVADKKIALVSRQTLGSNSLFTSFNSLSGTMGKFSYYTYYNYKQGDGYQDNSEFDSRNFFANLNYRFSERTSLSFDYTYFYYLAQQAGGLTDVMFLEDPSQSIRERNWFSVDWNLFALKFKHGFSENTMFTLNLFGLDASRKALGFRVNRVSQTDEGGERDLITGNFVNWGAEARILTKYNFKDHQNALLLGVKYYQSDNSAIQGPGSAGSDADFNFYTDEYPNYPNQSDYDFPNLNLAFFGENIFKFSETFSVTPGFRVEFINTKADGFYRNINQDNAGNVIQNETIEENDNFERSLALLGLGLSYKPVDGLEVYGNFSQNYRSVTFNDIRIANPSFQVDENINDEKGFTADLGLRGQLSNKVSYDANVFGLMYNGRIGEVLVAEDNRVIRKRGNIGKAFIYGLETFADWNIYKTFFNGSPEYRWNLFVNTAFTDSEYLESEVPGVEGNKVEFVPNVNFKTGTTFGYKNFLASLQYSYLSDQYTDASNAPIDRTENVRGIEGEIPAYHIMDLSFSYAFSKFRIETGINNLTNNSYFTRRATGYPGPGIIPSAPRTYYATLQFKF
ncbi:TonB-dependent receptor [Galbibacter sp. EGI 63066]|uniref:TonB-dependent receptor n=1 Tax=Galbibacter sp. EGI 63066 TaxID=2993559 RepID=UPI002248EB63|nr:TonB-dependent receptor [Galbibacter sp. EGI 63066]MCX2681098.1 TonB-dependent receptor [Galbibacter sp. EGI 63066]